MYFPGHTGTGLKKRPVQPSGTKNTETHKTDRNPPITSQKSWPFEPVEGNFCFLRGSLR